MGNIVNKLGTLVSKTIGQVSEESGSLVKKSLDGAGKALIDGAEDVSSGLKSGIVNKIVNAGPKDLSELRKEYEAFKQKNFVTKEMINKINAYQGDSAHAQKEMAILFKNGAFKDNNLYFSSDTSRHAFIDGMKQASQDWYAAHPGYKGNHMISDNARQIYDSKIASYISSGLLNGNEKVSNWHQEGIDILRSIYY